MSAIVTVQRLIAAALELAEKAKSDPALAQALLKDPTATVSNAAGCSVPDGVVIKASRGADGAIQFAAEVPPSETDKMKKLLGYGTLLDTAQQLSLRAKTDPELAGRLLNDPRKALAEASGFPVPEGVVVKSVKNADGQIDLSASIDSAFNGELDDMLLESVSGGGGSMPGFPGGPGMKTFPGKPGPAPAPRPAPAPVAPSRPIPGKTPVNLGPRGPLF